MSPATACSPSSSNPSLSSCNVDFGVRRLNPRRPRVLRECLLDPTIEQILSVVRSPTAQQHARLTALVHKDFFDYCSSESLLAGYDACFFCAGPSSAGMSEESYSHVIYDMTLAAAHTLVRLNPRNSWGTRRPTTAFRRRQPQHPDASLHRSLHPPLLYHQFVDKLLLFVFGPLVVAAALLVFATGIRRTFARFRSCSMLQQLRTSTVLYFPPLLRPHLCA